jgi:hypothetical protein
MTQFILGNKSPHPTVLIEKEHGGSADFINRRGIRSWGCQFREQRVHKLGHNADFGTLRLP